MCQDTSYKNETRRPGQPVPRPALGCENPSYEWNLAILGTGLSLLTSYSNLVPLGAYPHTQYLDFKVWTSNIFKSFMSKQAHRIQYLIFQQSMLNSERFAFSAVSMRVGHRVFPWNVLYSPWVNVFPTPDLDQAHRFFSIFLVVA